MMHMMGKLLDKSPPFSNHFDRDKVVTAHREWKYNLQACWTGVVTSWVATLPPGRIGMRSALVHAFAMSNRSAGTRVWNEPAVHVAFIALDLY